MTPVEVLAAPASVPSEVSVLHGHDSPPHQAGSGRLPQGLFCPYCLDPMGSNAPRCSACKFIMVYNRCRDLASRDSLEISDRGKFLLESFGRIRKGIQADKRLQSAASRKENYRESQDKK